MSNLQIIRRNLNFLTEYNIVGTVFDRFLYNETWGQVRCQTTPIV